MVNHEVRCYNVNDPSINESIDEMVANGWVIQSVTMHDQTLCIVYRRTRYEHGPSVSGSQREVWAPQRAQ
jgi:hypothetical protein